MPVGKDETENVVVREEGTKRSYDFTPKPHWDLGTALDIIDFERGVKISGSRFYVLKGWGARLQRALITLMLDLHTQKHGYVEIYPPYMVRRECLVGTGNLPKFGENLYRDAEEDFWFIPTAEVPVTNLYRDEIVDGARAADQARRLHRLLPARADGGRARHARHQARPPVRQGRAGEVRPTRDVDGRADRPARRRRGRAQGAGAALPGRADVHRRPLVFGDGQVQDLELWAPGCGEWLEVSSCSNFGDFQARRARIRFKDTDAKEKARFVHTLNGSGLALPRTLIGVLETYQRADGSIDVPAALRPYLGGAEILG